jgi:hypothetical protein
VVVPTVNKGKTTRAEVLLWSVIIAVAITSVVHAAAMVLPDWFSGQGAKQSPLENAVARFSEYWLMNAQWLAAAVAAVAGVTVFALLCRRSRFSSPPGNGAE